MENEKKTLRDKINEEIRKPRDSNTTIREIVFPKPLLAEFSAYAKEFTADCWWLAIKDLLEFKKKSEVVNAELSLVLRVIENINERLETIEEKVTEKKPKSFTHFGGKEEKK